MALFKKREDEDWDIWDYEDEEELNPSNPQEEPINDFNDDAVPIKPKKSLLKRKKRSRSETVEELKQDTSDYLSEESDEFYTGEDYGGTAISFKKVALFVVGVFLVVMGVVGYLNTDFDGENAYVVTYDLHYERDYVAVSDEVFDYCKELDDTLPQLMQAAQSNTITTTNELTQIQSVLQAKTDNLSRYTEIPEMMQTYHNELINFSLSTQEMITTILKNYSASDYLAWAQSAYSDYSDTFSTLRILRGEINSIIYRNVYGGSENE